MCFRKSIFLLENLYLFRSVFMVRLGHSLGAHICGYAGRHFYNLTDQFIPRITGLDPARPCFNEGERLNGLQRGDAAFVDIIHSNAGILGIKNPIGDVDFYPNG